MAFKIGQNVVCVDDTKFEGFTLGEKLPIAGHAYTVRALAQNGQCLRLLEIVNEPQKYIIGTVECSFKATRFLALRGKKQMPVFTVRGPIPLPSAWTPLSEGANLLPWYKADGSLFSDAGLTSITDGGAIEQVNDASPLGINWSQPTLANKPIFRLSSALNGKKAIEFTHANASELHTATNAVSVGGTTLAMFAVVRAKSVATFFRVASFLAAGQANDFDNVGSCAFAVAHSSTAIDGERNSATLSGATVAADTNYMIASVFDGSTHTFSIGSLGGSFVSSSPVASTGSFAATGSLMTAQDLSANQTPDGFLSEVFWTKSLPALSDVAAYFARWA